MKEKNQHLLNQPDPTLWHNQSQIRTSSKQQEARQKEYQRTNEILGTLRLNCIVSTRVYKEEQHTNEILSALLR